MAARPAKWDLEVDLVCVGSGLGATSAAIVAHDLGLRCALLEKAPKLGGLSAFGGGEVFVPANRHMKKLGLADSKDDGRRYVEFLAMGYGSQAAPRQVARHDARGGRVLRGQGRRALEGLPGPPRLLLPRRAGQQGAAAATSRSSSSTGSPSASGSTKTFLTPIMPMGALHEEMYEWGGLAKITSWNFELLGQRITNDQRTFGPGMMGFFVKAAVIDRKIPAYVETPVRELVIENGRVIGVRAERKDGSSFFVRAAQGRACSPSAATTTTRTWRACSRTCTTGTASSPRYLDGDHLVMGPEIGAAIASVPPTNLALFWGYQIPGEESEGRPLYRSSWECGCPHAIWVNQQGSASATSPSTRTTSRARAAWDGKKQEQPNLQPYLIFDGNYRERYPLGSFMPGQPLPEDMVVQADTPRELAAEARHPGRQLRAYARALQPVRGEGRGPGLRQGLAALGGAPGRRPLLPEPERRPAEQAALPRREARAGLGRHQLPRPQVEHGRARCSTCAASRSRGSTRSATRRRSSTSAAATRAARRTAAPSPGATSPAATPRAARSSRCPRSSTRRRRSSRSRPSGSSSRRWTTGRPSWPATRATRSRAETTRPGC